MGIDIALGTEKGGYVLRSDDGVDWSVDGPILSGWRVTAFGDAPDGRRLAAVASNWFGTAIHVSDDGLRTLEQVGVPAYPADGPELEQVWRLTTIGETVWAGVAEAGLFRSTDLETWHPVRAINEHPDRDRWMGGLGGLCAHHVLGDGAGGVWVGISSVGVLHSDDDGATWSNRDTGVPPTVTGEDGAPATGWCVHGLVNDPEDPDRIWRQEHIGLYRTSDGGQGWERCADGIPGPQGFGMPIVRDHASGRLFVVPLEADANRVPVDGRFAVWASDDDGDSWHVSGTGWPDEPGFTMVLRGAMAADGVGTVVAGTTSGQVWATTDAGDTWRRLPGTYPRIGAVHLWSEA